MKYAISTLAFLLAFAACKKDVTTPDNTLTNDTTVTPPKTDFLGKKL